MPNNPFDIDNDPITIAINICTEEIFMDSVVKVSSEGYEGPKSFKEEWNDRVMNCIYNFLTPRHLSEEIQTQIKGIVFSIALRMLTWTEFHMKTFDFDQDFCLRLLNMGIFTIEGIIDNSKTTDLVYSNELSVEQRFRLACWHCMREDIESLFNQLDGETKKYYVENTEDYIPEIVKFWAAFLMREEIQEVLPLMFENVISSGSKTALKYCINEITSDRLQDLMVDFLTTKDLDLDVLIPLVIQKMEFTIDLLGESNATKEKSRKYVDDWVAFRHPKCTKKEVWLPNHFVVDIFYSIFSRISAEKKKKIAPKLQEAIESNVKVRNSYYKQLFCHFFCWPYQNKLKEFLVLCWNYIPFCYYGTFLFNLLDRIKASTDSLYYGEDMTYDSIEFFLEFWSDSPEDFKRYVFKNGNEVFLLQDKTIVFNVGNTLLQRIITNKFLLAVDRTIITKILDLATLEEKKNFLNSDEGRATCEYLCRENKPFFTDLIGLCIKSEVDKYYYIKKLGITERCCLHLIENLNFIQARREVSSLNLRPLEQLKIKENILFSEKGIELLRRFGFEDRRNFDAFVEFSYMRPGHKHISLRQRLLDDKGKLDCLLRFIDNPESVDRFLKSCLSLSEISQPEYIVEEIQKVKRDILFNCATSFCDLLMFNSQYGELKMEQKLTHIDNILNWVFLDVAEDEKKWKCEKFKRGLMLLSKPNFHYKFISKSRFDDAALFFTWVGLDAEAIEIEKKNKLFVCYKTNNLFVKAMQDKDLWLWSMKEKQERLIRDLLKWCLVDSETLKKFVGHYFGLIDSFLTDLITDMNMEFMRRN